MKIEFYYKDIGEVLQHTADRFFIMNDEVWSDNGKEWESQQAVIGFNDCIVQHPDIGWKVVQS